MKARGFVPTGAATTKRGLARSSRSRHLWSSSGFKSYSCCGVEKKGTGVCGIVMFNSAYCACAVNVSNAAASLKQKKHLGRLPPPHHRVDRHQVL